jgi:hypothetical protein
VLAETPVTFVNKIIFDRPPDKLPTVNNKQVTSPPHSTMSSRFSLQNPYVVASLPRPIDRSNGRYVVGEVYGGVPGSKKRKRSELAVGIDGEGINLYDVRYEDIFLGASNNDIGISIEINHLLRTSSAVIFYLSPNISKDANLERCS